MREFLKAPDAVLDYLFDWTDWLSEGEEISESSFTVEEGLTKGATSNTASVARVWLSGGTLGQRYVMRNTITTNQNRTAQRSAIVRVGHR